MLPVILTEHGTFETATLAGAREGVIAPDTPRKITKALAVFEAHVDGDELLDRVDVARSDAVTPLMFEYTLLDRARAAQKHIVLPEGTDERVLRAAETLLRRRVVELTLLGREDEIRGAASRLGVDLWGAHVVDPHDEELRERFAAEYAARRAHKGMVLDAARDVVTDVSYFGTMMVALGMADGMVSGATHTTAETIRPAFELVKTAPGVAIVSSRVLHVPGRPRARLRRLRREPEPDRRAARRHRDLLRRDRRAVRDRAAGGDALLLDGPRRARAPRSSGCGRRPSWCASGRRSCRSKGRSSTTPPWTRAWRGRSCPDSAVAGRATVFIFPDLNTGNNTYKAVQRSAHAIAVGPVLQGLNQPVNDLSRGATVHDIVNTVAITAIQARMSVLTVNCGSSSLKWSVVDPPETLAAGTVQQVDDHAAALQGAGGGAAGRPRRRRPPRRARRRALLGAGADQRRGARGDPRPRGARAAAQPGQRGRDRGRDARAAGASRTSPSSTRRSTRRCRRARTPTPSRARGACAATASTAPRTRTCRGRPRGCSGAPSRRSASSSCTSATARARRAVANGAVDRHVDGPDAAGRAGHGHALAATSTRRWSCTSGGRGTSPPTRSTRCSTRARGCWRWRATTTCARSTAGSRPATRAAELALDVYCYRIRKYVGAYLAALGGADAIAFTAGVGENDAVVRARSLAGLERLGIVVDPDAQRARAGR